MQVIRTRPTRQDELDHTYHADHADQEYMIRNMSALKDLDHQVGIDHLPEGVDASLVCTRFPASP